MEGLPVPLFTTWPAFTEAMYMLGAVAGWTAQQGLWTSHTRGSLVIAEPIDRMTIRSRDLMAKYRDVPMDLADASLVALAEHMSLDQIFTFDADFEIFRIHGRRHFRLIPG